MTAEVVRDVVKDFVEHVSATKTERHRHRAAAWPDGGARSGVRVADRKGDDKRVEKPMRQRLLN